jgi:hypothetical protein
MYHSKACYVRIYAYTAFFRIGPHLFSVKHTVHCRVEPTYCTVDTNYIRDNIVLQYTELTCGVNEIYHPIKLYLKWWVASRRPIHSH